MTIKNDVPLKGEALWKSVKQDVADRNAAAHAAAREKRTARDARAAERQRAERRSEAKHLPIQPR